MPFFIYNTLTRKKEEFTPADPKNVKFYQCGPTVYNWAHIGNLYSYVCGDLMLRALRAYEENGIKKFRVDAVMNLTDIDDKTIRGTVAEAVVTGGKATVDGLKRHTQKYANIFLEDLRKLGCDQWNVVRRVTEVMPQMISITQKLLDNGTAYLAPDGSVYYSVAKAKNYGELAHLDFAGMKAGARVNNDEYAKDAAADFALWKAHDAATDGEIFWPAEFVVNRGKPDEKKVSVPGRPGWHIECSAMNFAQHGPQIDLHMGGIDLIFPHHQNEIAQSEGAFGVGADGKGFCRCWAHSGHVMEGGKKMAKRDGGFVTLKTLEEKYPGKERVLYRAFRMMCAQSHYRQGFDFSWEKLEAAMRTVEGLDQFLKNIRKDFPISVKEVSDFFKERVETKMTGIFAAIADDLDLPNAIAKIFHLRDQVVMPFMNTLGWSQSNRQYLEQVLFRINGVLPVFDLTLLTEEAPADVTELVAGVMTAKLAKDWPRVDALRAQALASGWRIVDQKDKTSRAERV